MPQVLVATDGTTINDSFTYDAYGLMLGGNPADTSGSTSLLYAGEQFDTDLQQYYLRARFYDPLNGRFNRTDPFAGSPQDPQSLHKYLYCHANPVNGIDPTGMFFTYIAQLSTWAIQKVMRGINACIAWATRAYLTISAMVTSLISSLRFGIQRFFSILYQYASSAFGYIARLPQSAWQRITSFFSRAPGVISQSQAAQSGYQNHNALVRAWKGIVDFGGNYRVHHFVEQGRGVARFGMKAIQSIANSLPTRGDLHQLISNFYSSGQRLVDFMRLPKYAGFSTVRDYVSQLPWELQWRWGKAVYDYLIMNGTLAGFNPADYGL